MKLTGSFEIKLNKDSVWKALNKPEILKKVFQDVRSLEKIRILTLQPLLQIKLDPLMQLSPGILNLRI